MTGTYGTTAAISAADAADCPTPPTRKKGMAIKQEPALPTRFNQNYGWSPNAM